MSEVRPEGWLEAQLKAAHTAVHNGPEWMKRAAKTHYSARIVEDKTDYRKLCGVCGNTRRHELHQSKAAPPTDYRQAPHAYVRSAPPHDT